MFDVLIRGGRIIDGSGSPWFQGSIGIEGDRLKVIKGDTSSVQAKRIIDASGRIVCPGFIDSHTHSDIMALSNPLHEPKIMQGITTELVGMDGIAYAPLSKANLEMMKVYRSGSNSNPKLDMEWSSVAEYLRCCYHNTSVNIGMLVPNGAVRIEVVGWDDRAATKDEIKQMQAMVRKGMEEGALGVSTNLDASLSRWADTDEMVELCKVVAELGGVYVTHVRYTKGDGMFDGFKEAIEIGKRSGCAVNISHYFCTPKTRGQPDKLLQIIDEARQDGVNVTFDAYPYAHGSGSLMGEVVPVWAYLGGPDALLKRLASKAERARMKEQNRPLWDIWEDRSMWEDWSRKCRIFHVGSEKNKWCEGLSLQEVIDRFGKKDPMDAICDLLIEENLEVGVNTLDEGDERDVRVIMQHPAGMISSDAILPGSMPNPRVYGSFPKILRWLVREEKVLTLEKAINKMTFLSAKTYGLSDRGILLDGMKADIVIFDPETVADRATVAEPRQYPVGIDYIFVNGKLAVEKGKHSGILNGEPVIMKNS